LDLTLKYRAYDDTSPWAPLSEILVREVLDFEGF
jgi:hypothetical protein